MYVSRYSVVRRKADTKQRTTIIEKLSSIEEARAWIVSREIGSGLLSPEVEYVDLSHSEYLKTR